MTEKQYGGSTGRGEGKKSLANNIKSHIVDVNKKIVNKKEDTDNKMDKEKILKAGEITKKVREYAKTIVKKGVPLLEIAEKIEAKIIELGGKPAFPTNLSIDNVAAHYTPSHDDTQIAHGLIKVDFGVHIDGWPADNSISFDLEDNEENKKLIEASNSALDSAIKKAKLEIPLGEIGLAIETEIKSHGFNPIVNLCGHSMERYDLHAGITVPNIDNKTGETLEPGLYAIEPFATNSLGRIHEGKPSGIYQLTSEKTPRSPMAREVLEFIQNEYNTLPFCERWIFNKLSNKGILGLRQLEANGNLHHFEQLVETSNAKVSQTEHTILVEENKITVTTL